MISFGHTHTKVGRGGEFKSNAFFSDQLHYTKVITPPPRRLKHKKKKSGSWLIYAVIILNAS